MSLVILPLCELLREVEKFNYLFPFYPEGVRGVVRDCFFSIAPWNSGLENEEIASEVAHHIWMEYSRHNELNKIKRTRQQDEKFVNLINEVTGRIALNAYAVMQSIFPRMQYEINPHWHRWVGNRLVISVDSWYVY